MLQGRKSQNLEFRSEICKTKAFPLCKYWHIEEKNNFENNQILILDFEHAEEFVAQRIAAIDANSLEPAVSFSWANIS